MNTNEKGHIGYVYQRCRTIFAPEAGEENSLGQGGLSRVRDQSLNRRLTM
jgi:hypothetical protein